MKKLFTIIAIMAMMFTTSAFATEEIVKIDGKTPGSIILVSDGFEIRIEWSPIATDPGSPITPSQPESVTPNPYIPDNQDQTLPTQEDYYNVIMGLAKPWISGEAGKYYIPEIPLRNKTMKELETIVRRNLTYFINMLNLKDPNVYNKLNRSID